MGPFQKLPKILLYFGLLFPKNSKKFKNLSKSKKSPNLVILQTSFLHILSMQCPAGVQIMEFISKIYLLPFPI